MYESATSRLKRIALDRFQNLINSVVRQLGSLRLGFESCRGNETIAINISTLIISLSLNKYPLIDFFIKIISSLDNENRRSANRKQTCPISFPLSSIILLNYLTFI